MRRRNTNESEEQERLLGSASLEDPHDEESGTKDQRKLLLRAASTRTLHQGEVVHRAAHRKIAQSPFPHVFPKHDPAKGTNWGSRDDSDDNHSPSAVRRHSSMKGSIDGKDDTWKDSDSTIEKDHVQKTDGNEYRIDYEEHMMPLTELAEAFQTEIDFNSPKNSPGLKPLQVNLLQPFVHTYTYLISP